MADKDHINETTGLCEIFYVGEDEAVTTHVEKVVANHGAPIYIELADGTMVNWSQIHSIRRIQ